MKKICLIIAILCGTMAYGQNLYISGSFKIGMDDNGNRVVYFQGNNLTRYNIPITIMTVNEELNENRRWAFNFFAGKSFSIGPNEGWFWQPGEKLIIYFPNGQSTYWVYGDSGTHIVLKRNKPVNHQLYGSTDGSTQKVFNNIETPTDTYIYDPNAYGGLGGYVKNGINSGFPEDSSGGILRSTSPSGNSSTTCYTCWGLGSCPVCKGAKYITDGFGLGTRTECKACGGTGKCWHCNGTGKQ
jgi:hypothetical protein